MRLLLAALVALTPVSASATQKTLMMCNEAFTRRVVDGSTLELELPMSQSCRGEPGDSVLIRLVGIECPANRRNATCGRWKRGLSCEQEMKLGRKAARRLNELAHGWSRMFIEERGKDRDGRILAYVWKKEGATATSTSALHC